MISPFSLNRPYVLERTITNIVTRNSSEEENKILHDLFEEKIFFSFDI